jgi:hypothetical protein
MKDDIFPCLAGPEEVKWEKERKGSRGRGQTSG